MKHICCSFILSLFYILSYSQEINGIVYDKNTNEPLTGASVIIKSTSANDGLFIGTNTCTYRRDFKKLKQLFYKPFFVGFNI